MFFWGAGLGRRLQNEYERRMEEEIEGTRVQGKTHESLGFYHRTAMGAV